MCRCPFTDTTLSLTIVIQSPTGDLAPCPGRLFDFDLTVFYLYLLWKKEQL
ncbi:hypothetical protein DFA_12061 [Cavenderia fasciculata]|uniref:Uncharacterized protein n=1 Tax=Cavenderia fasciculata TaxID=261658 RepID=F4QFJ0_CACFS|nr:uncharacterized protein DFA_12061 [Cavenderia fasciculata]EGG14291.1 hypothetical protein DFA_12061 [Cavenderia fasciculata]|eukprot:XP_004351000.1 hypothetical protein DFA_12061 [Cavenderia fasciculata]